MKAGLVMALYTVKALDSVDWKERPIKFIFASDEENLAYAFGREGDLRRGGSRRARGVQLRDRLHGQPFRGRPQGRRPGQHQDSRQSIPLGHCAGEGRSAVLEAAHKIVEIESQNDIMRGRLMNCGMVDGGIGENAHPRLLRGAHRHPFPECGGARRDFEILHRATNHNSVPDTTAELDLSRVMQCMDTTDGVMALFRHLQRTAQDCGFGEIGCFQVGGLSDSGITVACGVPTVCGMGVRGEGNHTPRRIRRGVESLFQRSVLAACAAYTLNDDFAEGCRISGGAEEG